jgi:hypothetical protein
MCGQRYGKHDESERTNDQSQHLGEERDIRHSHRLWPLSNKVRQIMQGLAQRTENRSNREQSADDHPGQACSTLSPRGWVHASNENKISHRSSGMLSEHLAVAKQVFD